MFEIFRSARLRRLFLCETMLILLVAVLSVRLRIGLGFTPDDPTATDEWPYWLQACVAGVTIPVAVQLGMYYLDLYTSSPLASRTQLLVRLLMAHFIAGGALALLYYLVPQYRVQRLALTTTTGKLSALDCWRDGARTWAVAVERHFAVTRLLRFELGGADATITPEVLLDLGPILRGSLNLEGLVRLPDGRLVAVVDNQYRTITGPDELLVFSAPLAR